MLFKPDKFVEEQKEFVSEKIKGKAIIACSGGVDSMVAAVIVSKAIGDRLLAVYVDTGLMRKGETDEVRDMLSEHHEGHRDIGDGDGRHVLGRNVLQAPEGFEEGVLKQLLSVHHIGNLPRYHGENWSGETADQLVLPFALTLLHGFHNLLFCLHHQSCF